MNTLAFISSNPNTTIKDSQTYTRNGHKYTTILTEGDFDYDLVQTLDNKTEGIEVYFMRKLIGIIEIGLLDDDLLNSYPNNEYYKIIGKNPFIHNVGVIDEFQNKGIATKLYTLLFEYLRSEGYKVVYSGKTRNSYYVNNLWSKFSDGFETLKDSFDTIKIYYKNLFVKA